jgi:hypothetical protein
VDDLASQPQASGLWMADRRKHAQSGSLGGMHLTVDTWALGGLTTGVRDAATAVWAVALPAPPPCEDVGAADAIGALLAVCREQLHALAESVSTTAALVDTARVDYTRAENGAVPRR